MGRIRPYTGARAREVKTPAPHRTLARLAHT